MSLCAPGADLAHRPARLAAATGWRHWAHFYFSEPGATVALRNATVTIIIG
jgi:hypothetical protein